MKTKPTVVDLFCGCGGLSYGLQQAGFSVILGTDFWEDSLKTFAYNHKGAKTLSGDITNISSKDILSATGNIKPDVIVGGPPCQGFSLSGPRNFFDKRNKLYLEFLRVVKDLEPKAFIIENVPGLASLFGGKIKERIIKEFTKLGYTVSAEIINASDYGVPQNRRRVIFIGLRNNKDFIFPAPTHFNLKGDTLPLNLQPKVTVNDAISDLPELKNDFGSEEEDYKRTAKNPYQKKMRHGSNKLYNHVASKHSEQTKKIISLVPEGGNYKDLPENLKNVRNFHVAWTRLHRDKPAPTIDTGHRHHFHPVENRVPTVRESARIQSFPDKFRFLGTKTSQYKQVGNAVPPVLAYNLGKELLKYLEE